MSSCIYVLCIFVFHIYLQIILLYLFIQTPYVCLLNVYVEFLLIKVLKNMVFETSTQDCDKHDLSS